MFLISFVGTHAQKVFDFSPVCMQAYNEITALKIKSGQQLIAAARKENPNNLIPELLSSYVDFFVLFFTEDPAEFKARKDNFDRYTDAVDEGPESSPFYLYSKAVINFHQSAVEAKFGERWNAGWDFRRAFVQLKDNRSKFPSFTPNSMLYGPMQIVVGSIPKGYKWLSNLMGMRGSVTGGMKMLRGFINGRDMYAKMFANEASFLYAYMMFYTENKQDEALQYIRAAKLDVVNNHLHAFMAANLGINNKQTAYAESVIVNRNKSTEYLQLPIWDFEWGFAKLNHLELPEAAASFDRFTKNFRGNIYLKDAYQKLSWAYYLQGNMPAAEAARKNVLNKGNTDSDADKKANRDAKSGVWPNPILLKARLLNDGGYHKEAYAALEGKKSTDFKTLEEQLEFIYRVARIYDELGFDAKAIDAYQDVINLGSTRKEYYASRSALQIANIYEKQGKKADAIRYYELCLSMEDHEYKDSIDQKAKSGLARCKGE